VEPASVGIVLDSSVIIAAERRGHTVREILEQVKAVQGEIEIGVSVVTIAELVHGAYRTKKLPSGQATSDFGGGGETVALEEACKLKTAPRGLKCMTPGVTRAD
jgi:predicted nucleic acid-binding protein